jgi:hypothetical protein
MNLPLVVSIVEGMAILITGEVIVPSGGAAAKKKNEKMCNLDEKS